ncbi:hypothetical protein LY76DRAFT_417405 [Colletotrichum caudatum]|nr:hypothetical protein LY76DRAFT_417405 [Colletotrichum caudatum]
MGLVFFSLFPPFRASTRGQDVRQRIKTPFFFSLLRTEVYTAAVATTTPSTTSSPGFDPSRVVQQSFPSVQGDRAPLVRVRVRGFRARFRPPFSPCAVYLFLVRRLPFFSTRVPSNRASSRRGGERVGDGEEEEEEKEEKVGIVLLYVYIRRLVRPTVSRKRKQKRRGGHSK